MTDKQNEARVPAIARLLWESGEMQSDCEGRNPTWDELCADERFFHKRVEVEGYAKSAIAAGLYPTTALLAEVREVLQQVLEYVENHDPIFFDRIDDLLLRISRMGEGS